MKKQILFVFVLLFSVLFAMPTQALSKTVYVKYALQHGNALQGGNGNSFGGYDYWENTIASNRWNGNQRPAPRMGDANIDGKVTAIDALFALKHSVYGNVLTAQAASGMRHTAVTSWRMELDRAYNTGALEQLTQDREVWIRYCMINSAFFSDVTKDCVVNAKDALQILKYSVGKAKNFPENDFTTVFGRFSYYSWPTEFSPDSHLDLFVDITDEEFCERYHFEYDVTPTDS